MSYDCTFFLVFVVGFLVSWSELLQVSGQKKALIPRRCRIPPKLGNCGGPAIKNYYYDVQMRKCQQFFYKGCELNDNHFVSLKNCINKCHLYVEMAHEQYQPGTLPIRCIFPKKKGHCGAKLQNYYYNTKTKKCEEFIYGGCGANPNNFQSIADCIKECECSGEGCKTLVNVGTILADLG